MNIHPVQTQNDLEDFIGLPYELYRDDPIWVPPLRSEQQAQFDRLKNPMLDHCETGLFLLRDGKQLAGRIAAFTDQLALNHWKQPVGLFGSYECIEDAEGSAMLLDAARVWLRAHGMQRMRGPWSFASQEWGLEIEGGNVPPVLMAPHNPAYYPAQLEAFGLAKIKDLLAYYVDAREGYTFPERFLQLTDKVQQRYGIRVRMLDMKRIEEDVQRVVEVSNLSIADNWGYYPVTVDEGKAMARDLKQIIHPKGVLFAEDSQGRPVGFAIALPDVNVLLNGMNGRMLPFGWLKLAWGLPRLKQYRMWALGVIPEYQGKAIDTLLYRRLYEELFSPELRMEVNYVLEDNERMNNALIKLGVKPLRRYRVYETGI